MPRRAISADGRPRGLLARERDRAGLRRGDPDQRLEQCRLAGAVAAEQCDDLVLVHVERDVVEDVALAVEGVDLVDAEQRRRRRRGARLGRQRGGAGADIDLAHLGDRCAHPRPCRRPAPCPRS